MPTTSLDLPEVVLFEPRIFGDARGSFFESFSLRRFEETTGLRRSFVQDNHSISHRGVLRGLHYQLPPFAFYLQKKNNCFGKNARCGP